MVETVRQGVTCRRRRWQSRPSRCVDSRWAPHKPSNMAAAHFASRTDQIILAHLPNGAQSYQSTLDALSRAPALPAFSTHGCAVLFMRLLA